MNACCFVLLVGYPNKKPYQIFSPSFSVGLGAGFAETEKAAVEASMPAIQKWVDDHYPDGTPLPAILKVQLGSMTFIPEVQP